MERGRSGSRWKGDVNRRPEVRVMTALLVEVTAERHFSRRAECEKSADQRFALSTASACVPTDALQHARNLSATHSKKGVFQTLMDGYSTCRNAPTVTVSTSLRLAKRAIPVTMSSDRQFSVRAAGQASVSQTPRLLRPRSVSSTKWNAVTVTWTMTSRNKAVNWANLLWLLSS